MFNRDDYNTLEYMLILYFGQDWIMNSVNSDFTGIMPFIYFHEEIETSYEIVEQIDKLLSLSLSDNELAQILRSLSFYPGIQPIPDKPYREWLKQIRDSFQYLIDNEEHKQVPWGRQAESFIGFEDKSQ